MLSGSMSMSVSLFCCYFHNLWNKVSHLRKTNYPVLSDIILYIYIYILKSGLQHNILVLMCLFNGCLIAHVLNQLCVFAACVQKDQWREAWGRGEAEEEERGPSESPPWSSRPPSVPAIPSAEGSPSRCCASQSWRPWSREGPNPPRSHQPRCSRHHKHRHRNRKPGHAYPPSTWAKPAPWARSTRPSSAPLPQTSLVHQSHAHEDGRGLGKAWWSQKAGETFLKLNQWRLFQSGAAPEKLRNPADWRRLIPATAALLKATSGWTKVAPAPL